MANYIIKNLKNITVQEADNWAIDILIDSALPFSDASFKFGVYYRTTALFVKSNLPKDVTVISSVNRNRVILTGVPADTLGHASKDLTWELELKKADGKFITIGQGKFIIKKTMITNQ